MGTPVKPFALRVADGYLVAATVAAILLCAAALSASPPPPPVEAMPVTATEEAAFAGSYSIAVADPPPGDAVAVEEVGSSPLPDGDISWAVAVRNTHESYAVRFSLRVAAAEGAVEETFEAMSSAVPPGGRVVTGGVLTGTASLAADATVAVEVVDLEWFAVEEGARAPEPVAWPLTVTVDSTRETADGRSVSLALAVDNAADTAQPFALGAIFYDGEGAMIGGLPAGRGVSVPPGESVREVEFPVRDVPAAAVLADTVFVQPW